MPSNPGTVVDGGDSTARMGAALPRVSVIITCYNHGRYLREAIDSARYQSYPESALEIIVVDDGSTDDTPQVLDALDGVRVVRQSNQGLSAARNAGLRASSGELILMLDADDRLIMTAVASGVQQLLDHPDWGFVFGHYRMIDEQGRLKAQWPPSPEPVAPSAFLLGNPVGMHGTVMYRRAVLEAAGEFDTELPACEDYDLYLRLAGRCAWGRHDHVVAEYRQHSVNMSRNESLMLVSALRVLDRAQRHLPLDESLRRAARTGRGNWKAHYARRWFAAKGRRSGSQGLPSLWRLAPREMAWEWCRSASQRWRDAASPNVRRWLRGCQQLLLRPWRSIRAGVTGQRSPVALGDFARQPPLADPALEADPRRSVYHALAQRYLNQRRWLLGGRGAIVSIGDAAAWIQWMDELRASLANSPYCPTECIAWDMATDRATFDLPPGYAERELSFDWIVIDRALQYQSDMADALARLVNQLRPGGRLISLMVGLGRAELMENQPLRWVAPSAAGELHRRCEGIEYVEVEQFGNVTSALAWVQGRSADELSERELMAVDPCYPLLTAVAAVRRC